VPAGGEATLSQLVGSWAHLSASLGYFWGYSDSLQFNADGTGSQTTSFWTDSPDSSDTTYEGTIALANHVITLDSTAGTRDTRVRVGNGFMATYKSEKLPPQIVRYGYSYDSRTDTLWVNTATCTVPLPFKRK